jgi:hypothetical protein
VRTLDLPAPGFALGHFGSFLFLVPISLVSLKNQFGSSTSRVDGGFVDIICDSMRGY